MGLEEIRINNTAKSQATIAFDTDYSYIITQTEPFSIYDVSFFKNVSTGGNSYRARTNTFGGIGKIINSFT